jgi:hypothetical protein
MMYFFSEVFFVYTGQNFNKSATIFWLRTELVEVMMMADIQTSATHCHHQNGALRLRRHVKPKSENDG